nr:penicillin-binding transpeptidase domain-containing protein [Bacillus aquiflavi]
MNWNIKEVARIINVSEEELKETIEREKKPFVFGGSKPLLLSIKQTRQINELKIPGVFAVERQVEVEDRLAEQLIGIIGENEKELQQRYPDREVSSKTLIGLTGLQASFDEFLIPEGETKLVYHVDATGAPLFGINVKYVGPANPFYPVNIKTTLDLEIQKMAEKLVDKHQIKKGGLVILDIETNSVLALVSRPAIDRANPFDNNGINNMMLKQQIMGSVFKTVVAAAAIDHKLISEERVFDCSKKINGDPDQTYQHGFLNFKNSFARSCNNAFGELAKELKNIDPGILEKYAEKMSLVNRVGWEGDIYHFLNFRQFNKEEKGRVFFFPRGTK